MVFEVGKRIEGGFREGGGNQVVFKGKGPAGGVGVAVVAGVWGCWDELFFFFNFI